MLIAEGELTRLAITETDLLGYPTIANVHHFDLIISLADSLRRNVGSGLGFHTFPSLNAAWENNDGEWNQRTSNEIIRYLAASMVNVNLDQFSILLRNVRNTVRNLARGCPLSVNARNRMNQAQELVEPMPRRIRDAVLNL